MTTYISELVGDLSPQAYQTIFSQLPPDTKAKVVLDDFENDYRMMVQDFPPDDKDVINYREVVTTLRKSLGLSPMLRLARVTYADGTKLLTSLASKLSDEEILDYFKIGAKFDIGAYPEERLESITNCEILI